MKNKEQKLILLGSKVKLFRQEIGLSQEKLAEICEFDRIYFSLIERGQKNISFINLLKLAKGLNITPSELIEDF
ncbi:MAG: helix-turn-helix transcriptional regulator [Sulfurospirillum sp.]